MRAILATMVAVWGSPGMAQDQEVVPGQAFGDWVVACEVVSTARNACRLVQTQTRSNGAFVLQLIAYPQQDGGALLVAQVPMGAYLPSGAVYRPADDAEAPQVSMIWQRCLGEVCEAALRLDEAAVTDLTQAGQIVFGYRLNPGEEPMLTGVDVSTLADGLAAIR